MPETLPGVLTAETPEILWRQLRSAKMLRVIVNDAPVDEADWFETRDRADGVWARVYLNYVGDSGAFDIAVQTPEDCDLQVSIRDKQVEYVHEVALKADVAQGVLRFAKSANGSSWVVSPSRWGGRRARPVELGDGVTPPGVPDAVEQRLTGVPEDYSADAEQLLGAMPILMNGIDEVRVVVDVSASMSPVVQAQPMAQLARLVWCLAYAAGARKKTCVLVGQDAQRSVIGSSVGDEAWAGQVQDQLAKGMPTGWPGLLEATLANAADRVFTVCLTDAPILGGASAVPDRTGATAVLVYDPNPALGQAATDLQWRTVTQKFAMLAWDGTAQLTSVIADVGATEQFGQSVGN